MSRSNKQVWQRKFIKKIFSANSNTGRKSFSDFIINNLSILNEKNQHIPDYLFKFYSPTSDNILDIKNQKLWLSHPSYFNDPFDCNIGYDKEKFEKEFLISYIIQKGCVEEENKVDGFTIKDKNRIEASYLGDIRKYSHQTESYLSTKWNILNSKCRVFKDYINHILIEKTRDLDNKLKEIKKNNIRIACFSKLDKYDDFLRQSVMWAHYADNHTGFCVEYNFETLKNNSFFSLTEPSFRNSKEEYLKERNSAIIKAGLFPVEYTSNRINIPVTKLNKIHIDDNNTINYTTNIEELIYRSLIVKSSYWSYEKEWRIIIDEKICNFYENKIPFPFIKSIYLGCNADKTLVDTMIAIGKEINAEVVLLKMDDQKFTLETKSMWAYDYDKKMTQWNNPYNY